MTPEINNLRKLRGAPTPSFLVAVGGVDMGVTLKELTRLKRFKIVCMERACKLVQVPKGQREWEEVLSSLFDQLRVISPEK